MKQKFLSFCSRMLLMLAFMLPVSVMADELTVNDGTVTSAYIPLNSYYGDMGTSSQFIIPESDLAAMAGGTISSLKFYAGFNFAFTGTWSVKMQSVSGLTLVAASAPDLSGATEVYRGSLSIASNVLTLALTTSFEYTGGDLLIAFDEVIVGNYGSSGQSFYGVTATSGASRYQYGSSSKSLSSFLPKVTFEYEPAVTGSCARPGKVVASDITDEGATFSWLHADGVSNYQYVVALAGEELDWSLATLVTDTFVVVDGLDAFTSYTFAVRSYCGAADDEQSLPQRATIKTLKACADMGMLRSATVSTGDSLKITWAAIESAASYDYVALPYGEELTADVAYLSTTEQFAAIGGLVPASGYTVYVRTSCSESKKGEWASLNVRTGCGVISTFPWSETFETFATGKIQDACWPNVQVLAGTGTGSTNSLFQISSTSGKGSSKGLQLPDMRTGEITRLTLPTMNIPAANAYELFIEVNRNTNYKPTEGIRLFVGDTELGFISRDYTVADVAHGVSAESAQGWYKYSFVIPVDGEVNIIIQGESQYGAATNIDNLYVREMPACRPARDLHVAEKDYTWVNFAWTPANGEADWKLQYKASDAEIYEETYLSEPSFTLEGLEAATAYTYNFILHSICDDVLSEDSAKFTVDFATACEILQPENDSIVFDGTLTPCFSQALVAGTGIYSWIASSGYYELQGAFGTTANARALIFPQMSLGDNWELLFDAWAGGTSAADSILVYVSETPSLEGALYVGAVKDFGTAAPADPYRLSLPAEVANQDLYLIFVGYHYNRLYLDNVILTEKPNCMPVTGLDYVGTIADEENEGLLAATFTWSRGGEEDLWACYYAIKVDTVGAEYEYFGGVDDPAETPEDTIFTVHALEPNTRYVVLVGVQSGCDGGNNLGAAVEREFSIKTPCGAISAVDYEEGFEDYAKGNNTTQPDVDCWAFLNVNSGSPYAYVNDAASYVHSGSKSLWFSSSATKYAYAIMPLFEEDLRDFRLSFWYNDESASSSGRLWVGYMTNVEDESTFVALDEVARTTTKTNALVALNNIPAEVESYRIAFKYGGASSTYYLGIDDLSFELLPSCVAVSNLRVEDVTATSAKIAWNPGKEETEWSVEVKKGSTVVYKDTIDVPYLLLDTLTSATSYSYTVLVKAMCDGAEAEEFLPAKALSFTTECEPFANLPWTESFENGALCWVLGQGAEIATSYPNTGSKSLKFNKTNATVLVVLPEFAAEISTLQLTYNWRDEGTGTYDGMGYLKAGYVTDPADATTFVAIADHNYRHYNDYEENTIFFTDAPAGALMAFCYSGQTGNDYLFVDDIVVEEIPSCFKPTNIHLVEGSVNLHEADFAWDGDAAQYEISLGTQTAIVNTNGVHMSGLNAGTNYVANLSVRAICAEGDTSAWSSVTTIRFATECEAIATLPYVENFENATAGDYSLPACWDAIKVVGASSSTNNVYVHNNATYVKDTKSLFFTMAGNKAEFEYAILPNITADLSNAEIKFSYKMESVTASGLLDFGYLTDVTDASTFVSLKSCARINAWCDSVVALANVPADARLAFRYGNAGSTYTSQYYLGIDDITVREIPSCLAASDLHLVDALIGLDTAVIAWTPYDVENLNARVILINGTDTVVDELVNDSIYVIRGLNPSTAYAFNAYVYTVCGELLAADAAYKALSFATECAPIAALPWSNDFEAETTNAMPVCWTKLGTASYPYVYGYSAYEGSKSLYFYGGSSYYGEEIAVSPEFDASIDLNTAMFSAYFKSTYASTSYAKPVIGTMSNPNDASTFVAQGTLDLSTSYSLVEVEFANVPADHHYVAIRVPVGSSAMGYYFDNVAVEPAPTCSKPNNIHVAALGQDSAVIAWSGSAAQYELIIADTQKADTVIVSDTCYVLRGLNHSTAYTYAAMLRGICAEGDSSKWVIASNLSFTTECGPITELPWSEDFEGASTCWTLGEGVSFATSTSYAKTGTKVLQFNKQNATTYAALPEFETELAALQFTYNWRCESNGSNSTMGYLEAGYMTDPSDISTFVQLQNHPEHKYAYEANTIYFPADVPAGARIAFRYSGQTGNYWLFVDDVEVRLAPTCKPVSNIHAENVTNSAASFAWTTNSGENEWILEIFKGTERLDSVLVYEPVFTIDTLAAETAYAYTVRVTASCGEGEYALPVEQVLSFTTLPACPLVTNIALAAVTENSATITWTAGLDENAWIVKTYLAGELQDSVEVSAENHTIMDLNANTKYTYTVVVLAKCGEEDFSSPAQAVLTFRTAMPAEATEVMNATTNREFTADFSSTDEQAKWAVVDGYGPNQFVFGTAAAALLSEATAALYVSNDGASYYYGTNSTSGAMIFRQIELPNVDSLLVEFDWLANGEFTSGTYYDYGVAILAPVAAELSIASSTLKVDGNTWSATSVPAGVFDLVDGRVMATKTVAQHSAVKLETVEAGVYKIVIGWRNDTSGGAQNPLSICNLSVKILDETGDDPTAMDAVNADENVEKFLYNGKVYIRRGNTVYTVLGQQVK